MAEREQVSFITQTEFEERLHIKRSTRYNWQRAGILVHGKHFYKIGGKLLYAWYPSLPQELSENSRKHQAAKRASKVPRETRTDSTGPNWEY